MRLPSSLVLLTVLAAACALSAPSGVEVHGKVLLTFCAGAQPANPPPGWQPCSTQAIPNATVVIAPTQGSVITVRTDRSGSYRVELSPAMYIFAGYGPPDGLGFQAQPQWVRVGPGKPLVWDVRAQINGV